MATPHDVERKRQRYDADPSLKARDYERRKQRQRERYQSDPAWRARRIRAATERKRFTLRGITREQFVAMLAAQSNQCAGCLRNLTESTARVDHDHGSGLVRGLLCHTCNITVHKHATPEMLRRLAAYLERK